MKDRFGNYLAVGDKIIVASWDYDEYDCPFGFFLDAEITEITDQYKAVRYSYVESGNKYYESAPPHDVVKVPYTSK